MVRIRFVVVALLVVSAGCSSLLQGEPQPASRDVSISVSNEHDASYTVVVSAIPDGVEGIEVTYENGSTRTFDVASLDGVPRPALRNATDVAATGGEDRREVLTVAPNEGQSRTMEGVPANATVVYFVRPGTDGEPLRSAGIVRCTADTGTTALRIAIRADGSLHAGVTCRDEDA